MSNTKRFLEHIEDQARIMSKADLMAEYPYAGVAELWDELNGPQQAELPTWPAEDIPIECPQHAHK